MRETAKETPCPLPTGRQTWVEVDLGALTDNFRALTSLLAAPTGAARVIPVVKAEAYGHGMIPVARALASAGATMFAVGTVDEGVRLRQGGIPQDILVLATSWPDEAQAALSNRLILAIDSPEGVRRLEAAQKEVLLPASVHIKVDTGMARLGVRWNKMQALLDAVGHADRVQVKGVFSHLSSADEADPAFTLEQIRRFEYSLSAVRESGLDSGEIHFANSAGILYYEKLRRWSARSGIALYGYHPDPRRGSLRLRPALSLKTRIGPIRTFGAGEPIGYNRKYVTSRRTRASVLPIGYADGFSRRLSHGAGVIVQNRWAPVIGAVSMDMISVDLTDLPAVREGDEVIILGSSAGCRMTAEEWASIRETIPYEILCGIGPRIPRIYLPND